MVPCPRSDLPVTGLGAPKANFRFRPIADLCILGQSGRMGCRSKLKTEGIGAPKPGPLAIGMLLASFLLSPAVVQAEDHSERVVEPIHSALPLFTFEWDHMWPRSFRDGDEFGCVSHVPFGDWRFQSQESDRGGKEAWYRFDNYGVFHCAAIMRRADSRPELETARHEYGFFVRLGKARLGSAEWDLWAIQTGTNPGSNYTLMAREAARKGRIEEFLILQQRCPSSSIMEAKGLDVWNTRYCAINSREELLSLARRMLKLPAVGKITRIAPAD